MEHCELQSPSYSSYGPNSQGATLLIDPQLTEAELPELCTFDIETDGSKQQNFVGIGICPNLKTVWYFTALTATVRKILSTSKLIAHNVKADLHFAAQAGINIPLENVFADTQLMSYCVDSARMKHGLKVLAAEKFNAKWPSYEEMTEGHKVSLAIQPVEKVANYCGRDALETLRLFYHFHGSMTAAQKRLHYQLELPEALVLFLREKKGVKIDVEYLKSLQTKLTPEMAHLEAYLVHVGKEIGFSFQRKKDVVKDFNPNAPAQVVSFFNKQGLKIQDAKAETLEKYVGNPVVDRYREFKKLSKLMGTYIDATLEREGLPYIHTTFKQTQTITSRLASEDPNLQNIPSKGEYGDMLREMFVAREGHTFLDADFSNMELRVGAHFSEEPVWLEAFNDNRDIHQAAADKIKAPRTVGKVFNLSALYGVGAKKLARTLKCSESEAEDQLKRYWRGVPRLHQWIEDTKRTAAKRGGVYTLMGRFIGYPALFSDNKYERFEAERQCVNAIIQGTSAEITKLADINLYFKHGVLAVIQCHDELLFEIEDNEDKLVEAEKLIVQEMQGAVSLRCPMIADVGRGRTWRAAKG